MLDKYDEAMLWTPDRRTPEQRRIDDEKATGRPRCIGCGKFLKVDARWNQCGSCDTRYPEEIGLYG